MLRRFCAMVIETPQTPHLISRVATDAAFVGLCQLVTGVAGADFEAAFQATCNRHQFNAARIRRRLLPVARALRLDARTDGPPDYYALLGVAQDADGPAVKQAFRRQAHRLHPDKQGGDNSAFIALQAAYVHLSNTELRSRHDLQRRAETWVEANAGSCAAVTPPAISPSKQREQARRSSFRQFCTRMGTLVALLVFVAFGVDLCWRESDFQKGRHSQSPEPPAARALQAPPRDGPPRLAIYYADSRDRDVVDALAGLFNHHFLVTTHQQADYGVAATLLYFHPEDRSAAGEVLRQADDFLLHRRQIGLTALRLERDATIAPAATQARGSLILQLSAPGSAPAPSSTPAAPKR